MVRTTIRTAPMVGRWPMLYPGTSFYKTVLIAKTGIFCAVPQIRSPVSQKRLCCCILSICPACPPPFILALQYSKRDAQYEQNYTRMTTNGLGTGAHMHASHRRATQLCHTYTIPSISTGLSPHLRAATAAHHPTARLPYSRVPPNIKNCASDPTPATCLWFAILSEHQNLRIWLRRQACGITGRVAGGTVLVAGIKSTTPSRTVANDILHVATSG